MAATHPAKEALDAARDRKYRAAAQVALLCLLTVVCLGPFLRKAIHIDDPLFVWSAQHIVHHPLDPYGFEVNWFRNSEPMATATKNPPLTCYYLALAGSLIGWSEARLHAAMLLPTLAAVLGTFFLAQRLCRRPLEAALCTLVTPVFIVSATTLMCDVMMLAFWVWAVFFWVTGLEDDRFRRILLSSVLATLGIFTKYYAAALLPLFLVHGLIRRRRIGAWLVPLGIPVIAMAAYHFWTLGLYNRSLLLDAVDYAQQAPRMMTASTIVALAFTGGCAATVLFYIHRLWAPRTAALWFAAMAAAFAILGIAKYVPSVTKGFLEAFRLPLQAHLAVMAVVGLLIVWLSIRDAWRSRTPESLLLLAWVLGTFVFAGFVNWSANGRSILPMIPAVMIIAMRRLDERETTSSTQPGQHAAIPLALAAALSFTVAHADYVTAAIGRTSALEVCRRYGSEGNNIWFVGHWGFQYYMQSCGARPVDQFNVNIEQGDIVAVPYANTCLLINCHCCREFSFKRLAGRQPPGKNGASASIRAFSDLCLMQLDGTRWGASMSIRRSHR